MRKRSVRLNFLFKIIYLQTFLLLIYSSCFSQVTPQAGFIGLTGSSVMGFETNYNDKMAIYGESFWSFGSQVYGEIDLPFVFSFRPAIGFLRKGNKAIEVFYIDQNEVFELNHDLIFDNYTFDLVLKLSNKHRDYSAFVTVGLRTDVLRKTTVVHTNQFDIPYYEVDISEKFNNVVYSSIIGLGYNFDQWGFIEANLNRSLTDNYSSNDLTISIDYYGFLIGVNLLALAGYDY